MQHNSLFLILVVLTFFSLTSYGQTADSTGDMRLFLKVCNDYKKLPLQLDMEIRRSTNLITGEEDTLQSHILVYMQERGSYVALGELEQLANDSLLLLVSNKLKRMALYSHRLSMDQQLKKYLGIQLGDSTVMQLTAKYRIIRSAIDKDTSVIELNSRIWLYQTTLPRESVTIRYAMNSWQPARVIQTKRSLIPVQKAIYEDYARRPGFEGKVVALGDSSFFLVREQVSCFDYKGIGHRQDAQLPVTIADRIEGNLVENYNPVKKYGDFVLTRNF